MSANIRQRLLTNIWCGQCRHEVTITNFSGTLKGGNLLHVGKCVECQGDVARVIEGSGTRFRRATRRSSFGVQPVHELLPQAIAPDQGCVAAVRERRAVG